MRGLRPGLHGQKRLGTQPQLLQCGGDTLLSAFVKERLQALQARANAAERLGSDLTLVLG